MVLYYYYTINSRWRLVQRIKPAADCLSGQRFTHVEKTGVALATYGYDANSDVQRNATINTAALLLTLL